MKRIYAPVMVGLSLALLLVGCGSDVVDDGPIDVGDADLDEPAVDDTSTDDPDEGEQPDNGADDASDEGDEVDGGEPDEGDTTAVRLYYLGSGGDTPARAGPFLTSVEREIPSTPGIALATLRELVDGPAEAEVQLVDDLTTSVPEDTLVLGVTIDDGLATVDLSREFESGGGSLSMLSRLAQVVYTVTQFPTVDEVSIQLDGQPVTAFSGEGIMLDQPVSRDDYLDLLPAVFVDTPAAGAEVASSMKVTGMATVFEATFLYRLEAADGTVLEEGFATAESGVETSPFEFTIDYDLDEEQQGTLTVWEESAKDGSVQGERTTPVLLRP